MSMEIMALIMFGQMVGAVTNAWNGKRQRTQQWTQHCENIGFQRDRFEKEKEHQKSLESMRRETQLQQAREKIREIYKTREVHRIFDNWPLKLVPSQYLMNLSQTARIPLKIIVAPPDQKRISGKQLEHGLRLFLEKNYPLHDPVRPAEFLGGAWDERQMHAETCIKTLFGMLQAAPTLIIESQLIEDDLNLYIGYWGIAQQHYCYQHVARISHLDLMIENARDLALQWRTIRDNLSVNGVSSEEAEKYAKVDAHNLKVYEEEERIRRLVGDQVSKLNFQQRYEFDSRHYMAVCDQIGALHCLLAGCIVDVYHLLHHDTPPLLPRLLPEFTATIPEAKVIPLLNSVAGSYCAAYEAMEVDRPAWAPEFCLDLAQSFATLPDKSWAEKQVERSMRSWLSLRNIEAEGTDGTEEMLAQICNLKTPDDKEYITQLKESLVAIGSKLQLN